MHHLRSLVTCIVDHKALVTGIGHLDSQQLTRLERCIVEIFARSRGQIPEHAFVMGRSRAIEKQMANMAEQVRRFAQTVADAKRSSLYVSLRGHSDDDVAHVALVSDLTLGERMVIRTLRDQVRRYRDDGNIKDDSPNLTANDLPKALVHVRQIIEVTATSAFRTFDIRCNDCGTISPDEARILYALALGQREPDSAIQDVLSSWLLESAVHLILPVFVGLARLFHGCGYCLPLRHWNYDHLEKMQGVKPMPIERAIGEDRRILH